MNVRENRMAIILGTIHKTRTNRAKNTTDGRNCMVVEFTTTCLISTYHH